MIQKILDKNGIILNTKDKYCTENIEVEVVANDLKPENVVKGKMILGVIGAADANGITPTGTITITENGTHDVTSYASALVEVEGAGGITPEGTIELTENGDHDVTNYATASVNVPIPEGYIVPDGEKAIITNGKYDITSFASVDVNVPQSSAEPILQYKEVNPDKTTQTVLPDDGYDGLNAVVVRPIPDNYITPSGTKEITTNGTHEVRSFYNVNVNVPIPEGYIKPSGNFAITENGDYNIRDKETVSVSVAGGGGGEDRWDEYMSARVGALGLEYLFCNCPLTSYDKYIAGYDTSRVTNTRSMFENSKVVAAPMFDTSSVKHMYNMFDNCKELTSVPLYNTSSAQLTYYMFEDCVGLQTVPLFDFSNVTDMDHMFSGCLGLVEVPQFNTSKCTDMESIFYYCSKLTSAPLLDTSKVTSVKSMFQNCTSLTSSPLYDLSSATNISSMFSKCSSLKTIEMNSWEKVTSQYNTSEVFAYCYTLNKVVIRNATKAPLIYAGGYTKYGALFRDCYCMSGIYNAQYNPRGKSGRVYVPDALVDTFKTATNWSTYADIIYPESESEMVNEVADLTSMKVFNSTTTPYIDKVDGEYQYEIHSGSSVYQLHFNVPEEATNRVMKIRFKHSDANTSYLFATTAIDDTSIKYYSDATADNTYFYHNGIDNGVGQEIIYENLPTGDHFICLPWQNSGTSILFSVDFVE